MRQVTDDDQSRCYAPVCARSDALSSLCFKEHRNSLQQSTFNVRPSHSSYHSHITANTNARSSHNAQSSITSLSELTFSTDEPTIQPHDGGVQGGSGRGLEPAPDLSGGPGGGTGSGGDVEWSASHYRRVAHEEMRRDERREERRRRRRERMNGIASASSSVGSRGIPDLIGGYAYGHGIHSRDSSITTVSSTFSSLVSSGRVSQTPSLSSSVSSHFSTNLSLSRNASTTSKKKASAKPTGFAGIMESDEDGDAREWVVPMVEEEEAEDSGDDVFDGRRPGLDLRTVNVFSEAYKVNISRQAGEAMRFGARAPTPLAATGRSRKGRTNTNGSRSKVNAAPTSTAGRPGYHRQQRSQGLEFGLGDVLDEIIKMEQGFHIESEEDSTDEGVFLPSPAFQPPTITSRLRGGYKDASAAQPPMRFASTAPPKTPPAAIMIDKRDTMIPPPAPMRAGHHLGDANIPPSPSFPIPAVTSAATTRRASQSSIAPPAFASRHMPTFSEPNACYSPLAPGSSPAPKFDALPARSSSPIRRSLTFTPTAASISVFGCRPPSIVVFDRSETPTKNSIGRALDMQVDTPPMSMRRTVDPSRSSSPSAHRSRRPRVDSSDSVLRFQFPKSLNVTPMNPKFAVTTSSPDDTYTPTQSQQPTLPSSSSIVVPPSRLQPALFPSSPFGNGTPPFATPPQGGPLHAPTSGVRLGVLCGSGNDEDEDVDMEVDVESPGHLRVPPGFLPVYIEAEGHRSNTACW